MNRKTLYALVAVAAVVLAAGSAQAHGPDRSTIAFTIQNVGDATSACSESLFGLSFDMVSPAGALLGTGRSCVHSIDDGCAVFAVGCRQIVRATFTLDFGRGSLTVPMKLREVFVTESSLTQRGTGKIAAGTGAFSEARGRLKGGGTVAFTEQGIAADLIYVVHLKGELGDDD
jgi:hypothetical protein